MNKLSKSIWSGLKEIFGSEFSILQQWACGRQLQPARISSIGWSQGILDHHFHIFFTIGFLDHFHFLIFSGRFQGFMILFILPGKSKGPTNHHFHTSIVWNILIFLLSSCWTTLLSVLDKNLVSALANLTSLEICRQNPLDVLQLPDTGTKLEYFMREIS